MTIKHKDTKDSKDHKVQAFVIFVPSCLTIDFVGRVK